MAREVKTSESHPIEVFWIQASAHGTPGRLGLTFAPGKRANSVLSSARWERALDADLQRLRDHHGADVLVSLMEPFEYDMLGIPELFERAEHLGIRVLRLPIVDVSAPTDAQAGDVDSLVRDVRAALKAGETVVIHCRGGRGRTGTIAAIVLTTFGHSASEAIAAVRQAQPGAVETWSQQEYVAVAARRLAEQGASSKHGGTARS